ncbi:hypothetical protein NE237_025020 [Protea cynaroides]|uniref:Nucleotide-diphospho-sugar transferase domain-containing protein n=1 Tax=Protea cynaroides TaxID=273540 RepID=A0A9Q0H690_9MAGN|nr:hypothetical protein NE237_025020 [Protea cynaroides]
MRYSEKNNAVSITVIVLSLIFFGVLYICISTTSIFQYCFPFQNCQQWPSSDMNIMDAPKDDLEIALEEASMENRTVIIAILNKAYVEGDAPGKTMLDMFLEAFWVGENTIPLLDHLLLVAVDQTAYDRCKFRRLHCYKLVTNETDFSKEELFMSEKFLKMMWARVHFLGDVLRRGYSFLFTDTDVMWLRNPFNRLSSDESVDFQCSSDHFNGDPWSYNNHVNTGFYFVRPNQKTIALFDSWYARRENSTGMNEQHMLEKMKNEDVFKQLGLKMMFMDTVYFSGYCVDSWDFNAVTTVHANCCRGTRAKVSDMTVTLDDWKKYKSSTNRTMTFKWSNHTACIESWLTWQV